MKLTTDSEGNVTISGQFKKTVPGIEVQVSIQELKEKLNDELATMSNIYTSQWFSDSPLLTGINITEMGNVSFPKRRQATTEPESGGDDA